MDLNWSPDDSALASGSLGNTIQNPAAALPKKSSPVTNKNKSGSLENVIVDTAPSESDQKYPKEAAIGSKENIQVTKEKKKTLPLQLQMK